MVSASLAIGGAMVTMTVLTILMKITVFKSAMNKGWFQSFLPKPFFISFFFSEKNRNQKPRISMSGRNLYSKIISL